MQPLEGPGPTLRGQEKAKTETSEFVLSVAPSKLDTSLIGDGPWKPNGMMKKDRAWITNSRTRVLQVRLRAHEKRNGLRRARTEMNDVDMICVQILSRDVPQDLKPRTSSVLALPSIFEKKSSDDLIAAVQKVLSVREKYNLLEKEYNGVEDELDQLEYELEKAEDRFYRQYSAIDTRPGELQSDYLSSSSSPYVPSIENGSEAAEGHFEMYLEESDLAQSLKDKIHGLRIEKARVARKDSFPLEEADDSLFRQLEKSFAQTLVELKIVEDRIISLRERCLKDGLFSNEEYPYEPIASHALSLNGTNQERFPLLFPAQGTGGTAFASIMSESVTPRHRINKWLFQTLRESPLELDRYRAGLNDQSQDDEAWTRQLLAAWASDEAAVGRRLSPGSSSVSRAITVSLISEPIATAAATFENAEQSRQTESSSSARTCSPPSPKFHVVTEKQCFFVKLSQYPQVTKQSTQPRAVLKFLSRRYGFKDSPFDFDNETSWSA
ncbi:MAG: hypothetical protein M1827_006764 [Pycnora praestabilis]|nr:MAG: hypothetical protein M1827_006764 [Pycnora praestabilis]